MKKIFIIFTLLFFIKSEVIYSQIVKSYGFKFGTTYSSFDWIPKYAPAQVSPEIRSLNSYNFALFEEFKIFSHLSLVTQIEYANKGSYIIYTRPGVYDMNLQYEVRYADRLSYLSIPLLIKIASSEFLPNAYIVAGPRIDHLYVKKIENTGYSPVYNNLKQTVYGSSIGLGVQASTLFYVEGRYNIDFTNSSNRDDIQLRNNSFDMWFGFGF